MRKANPSTAPLGRPHTAGACVLLRDCVDPVGAVALLLLIKSSDQQQSAELATLSSGVLGAMPCICSEDELVVWCQLCDMRCALSTSGAQRRR